MIFVLTGPYRESADIDGTISKSISFHLSGYHFGPFQYVKKEVHVPSLFGALILATNLPYLNVSIVLTSPLKYAASAKLARATIAMAFVKLIMIVLLLLTMISNILFR